MLGSTGVKSVSMGIFVLQKILHIVLAVIDGAKRVPIYLGIKKG